MKIRVLKTIEIDDDRFQEIEVEDDIYMIDINSFHIYHKKTGLPWRKNYTDPYRSIKQAIRHFRNAWANEKIRINAQESIAVYEEIN